MNKRKAGDQFGCTDTAPPKHASEYVLSRLLDVLDVLKESKLYEERERFWQLLSHGLRMDFNYANWKYEERKFDN